MRIRKPATAPVPTLARKPLPLSTQERIHEAGLARIADHAQGRHTRPVLGCPRCG